MHVPVSAASSPLHRVAVYTCMRLQGSVEQPLLPLLQRCAIDCGMCAGVAEGWAACPVNSTFGIQAVLLQCGHVTDRQAAAALVEYLRGKLAGQLRRCAPALAMRSCPGYAVLPWLAFTLATCWQSRQSLMAAAQPLLLLRLQHWTPAHRC